MFVQATADVLESDMRAIVRLLGRVAVLPGTLMAKRCFLLDGLCEFADADEWIWSLHDRASMRCVASLRRTRSSPPLLPGSEPVFDVLPEPPSLEGVPDTHQIGASRLTDSGTESRFDLTRNPGRAPFPDRGAQVVVLVLEEVTWLHWRAEPPTASKTLSPRLSQVRDLLVLGLGRKEIADLAEISPGTVSGYMREIYQHFGVNSQAELIRRSRLNATTRR
jgi:DNA-binding CsgD family transcriptional regulator